MLRRSKFGRILIAGTLKMVNEAARWSARADRRIQGVARSPVASMAEKGRVPVSARLLAVVVLAACRTAAGAGTTKPAPPSSPALRYRPIILPTPGWPQSILWSAAGRFWVGEVFTGGGKSFCHAVVGHLGTGRIRCLPSIGLKWSLAAATDGKSIVGSGSRGALMWTGAKLRVISLAPAGSTFSQALGVSGDVEVGYARRKGGANHAMLWHGSAESCVDLNPQGYESSVAMGVDAGHEVGWGVRSGHNPNAMVWSGSAASARDINPQGFKASKGYAIRGRAVVGYGTTARGQEHALLWRETKGQWRATDLNPPGYEKSICYAVTGGCQAGTAVRRGHKLAEAIVWRGTAASAANLQGCLPKRLVGSQVCAIDRHGDMFGFSMVASTRRWRAIEWKREGPLGSR